MSKKANPATIGAFIVGAIILLIVGILVFSSEAWFNKNDRFIVFFDESINGLNIGAPIKLSGVNIGQVTEINVERDRKLNQILVPVIFEVNPKKIKNFDDISQGNLDKSTVDDLINSGLRMQLKLSSMLTGQLFIEALFLPNTEAKLYGHRPNLTEIPSVPSSSEEIQKTLRSFLADIKNVDFKKFFNDIEKTISNIEELTGSEQTRETFTALNASMLDFEQIMSTLKDESILISRDLRKTINRADQLILTFDANAGPLLKETQQTMVSAKTALKQLNSALINIESLTNSDSPISQDLQTALQELARAARSTRVMMDYLERHPDALIYGKEAEAGVR
jgi:paraquat-inducible protein B